MMTEPIEIRNSGVVDWARSWVCVVVFLSAIHGTQAQERDNSDRLGLPAQSRGTKEMLLLGSISAAMQQGSNQRDLFGYPVGATENVIMAIRASLIYDGQALDEIEKIFGKQNFIKFSMEGRRLILIPLDYGVEVASAANKKKSQRNLGDVSTIGSQWHLFFCVNDNNRISDLCLRHGSLKSFMKRGLLGIHDEGAGAGDQ